MSGVEPVPLEVRRHTEGPAIVVEAEGDLVVTSETALAEAVEEALEEGNGVVVDASGLTHVDTAGLALFVHLRARCAEKGGDLVVAGLPDTFSDIADHLRLERGVPLAEDVGSAIDRLGR